uniref:Uncharacterized protein n=1 Tax=Pararge aegeria TaxID=116150 RepID=S4PSY3_9NEOP
MLVYLFYFHLFLSLFFALDVIKLARFFSVHFSNKCTNIFLCFLITKSTRCQLFSLPTFNTARKEFYLAQDLFCLNV